MRTGRLYRYDGSFAPTDDEYVIEGVAIVYNKPTLIREKSGFEYIETIAPEAVLNALQRKDDVRCLVNHDSNLLLGRASVGTCVLWTESDGLHFRVYLDPEVSYAKDYWRMCKRGDINQCSFAFTVDDERQETIDGVVYYTITDLTLYDVSLVVYPAYSETTAEARSDTDLAEREDATLEGEVLDKSELKDEIGLLSLIKAERDLL